MRQVDHPGDRASEQAERLEIGSETWLVARIRARDARVFEDFYRTQHGRLSRFLLNLLGRPHLVEEVLDDAMMVVWTDIEGFGGHSRLSTWLFGIAYRQAMNALRRLDEPVADPEEDMASAGDTPEEAAAAQWSRRSLDEAMAQISANHRAVLELTYRQDFGYAEIAEIMACPVDTVKTRMFHARRQLRQLLPGNPADWL